MTLPRRNGYDCGLGPGPISGSTIEQLIQTPLEGMTSNAIHARPDMNTYLTMLKERYHEVCRDLVQAAQGVPAMALATYIVRIRRRFAELFGQLVQEAMLQDADTGSAAPSSSTNSGSTAVMKRWFLANLTHPYPNNQQKEALAAEAGITFNQVNNWFVNVRMRVWRPLVKNFGFDVQSRTVGIFPMTRTQESLPVEVVNNIINELRKVD